MSDPSRASKLKILPGEFPVHTSEPNGHLLGIELRAEELVEGGVEDIVELEEGLDDELQVELDDGAVECVDAGENRR